MSQPKECNPQLLAPMQRIVVFQQNGSGEQKIEGIRRYGRGRFDLRCIHIDQDLPPVIDDASDYLPSDVDADLVLDFLKHPDLSYDLAVICGRRGIPVVASGKKIKVEGTLVPPT
jgi:hypothetical protein